MDSISVGLVFTIIGGIIGYATFYMNSKRNTKQETKEEVATTTKIDTKLDIISKNVDEIISLLSDKVVSEYENKIKDLPIEITNEFEKVIRMRGVKLFIILASSYFSAGPPLQYRHRSRV